MKRLGHGQAYDCYRGLSASKQISVETIVAQDCVGIVLDASKMKQVLFNYASNGLKFTEPGGRLTISAQLDDPDHLRLDVSDTGIGIRAEDIGSLFAEFRQLDASTTKRHQGTGLGLAQGLATGKATASETREMLQDAFEASQRVETIVRDLKLFSRTESEAQISVDVNAVLESTLRMARNEIRHRAHVVTSYQAVPPVRGTASRLGQVFLNLLVNAAQAIPEGQANTNEIKISTEVEAAESVLIQISDTGSGISSAQAAKMFTPFATTKAPGIGTGLGLAICQRIVAGLGGTLTFESEVGCGTVFRVRLPIDRAPIAAVRTTQVRVAPRRRGHILVIDDDNAVGTLVRNALSSDHDVTFMNDAGQCLEELAGGARFDLILCDLMMPVISGIDFYTALQKLRLDLVDQVLFMTGGAFTPRARDFMDTMSRCCVEKPLDLCTLRALVNDRVR